MLFKKEHSFNKILLSILLGIVFICLFINSYKVFFVNSPSIFESGYGEQLNIDFDIYKNGEFIDKSTLPYTFESSTKNEKIQLVGTLSSDTSINNQFLSIRTSGYSITIKVDGIQIYNSYQENVNDYGGGYYHFIRLPDNSNNKQITIDIFNPSNNPFAAHLFPIQIGSTNYLMKYAFTSDYESLFFGMVMISFGFVFLGSIIFFKKSLKNPFLFSLSLLLLCFGLWVLTQSKSKQLIGITNPALPMIFSFFTMVSLPICLWFYVNTNYKEIKNYKILKYSAFLILSLYIPISISSFFGVPYTYFLSYIGLLILIFTLMLTIISIKIYRKGEKSLISCIVALFSIFISIIVEEVLLLLNIAINHVSFLHAGMAIAAIIFIYQSISNLIEKKTEDNEAKLLKKLAYLDFVTLVENRNAYEKFIDEREKECCNYLGIILADINGLKIINDLHGHRYGDALLKKASKDLKEALPLNSRLYRIGGDEFVGIINSMTEEEFNKFVETLQEKFVPTKNDFGMAIGSHYYIKENDGTLKQAIEKTDKDMYNQKISQKHLIHKSYKEKGVSKDLLFMREIK